MREMPINKGLHQFHRSVARIWKLLRRVRHELLIIGSQVRALVRPPSLSRSNTLPLNAVTRVGLTANPARSTFRDFLGAEQPNTGKE